MFLLFILSISFSSVYASSYPTLTQHDLSSHRSVYSSVWTVKGDMVILETEERTFRSFGVKEWVREGFSAPEEGDEVTLILDRGNTIIDLTEPGGKGGFMGNEISGIVQEFNGPMKWISIKTEFGVVKRLALKGDAATKLNKITKGRMVTLSMDGQNRVMDAYRP
ncbi:MAG: hypothetical protein ACE5FZ_00085 [Nitrospiria bacterium]